MKIYVLGICGTFMGGLAQLAAEKGIKVSGCDENVYPPMDQVLLSNGISIDEGFNPKNLPKDVDLVVVLSLLLVDQTKNFERFVKDFQLSNEIKNRLSNLQSQFTFKTADKIEKTDYLKKSVLKYGQPSVIDYIHFQYLINEKYDYSLYEKNIKIIKETASPKFEFDVNILKKKGFKDDKNLGNALNFIKQRWIANNFQIRDKDIDDAVQLFK